MKKKWTTFKSIIAGHQIQKDIFLSLINEEGTILCANANMVKTLHLKDPRKENNNFFDLLHPVNLSDFKTVVYNTGKSEQPHFMEVYLKNGYYHPMKWQINPLVNDNGKHTFLCVGHKIMNADRLKQFNQLGKQNYQLIVERLNTGVLFQDKRGELIAANQKAALIFNTTLESLYLHTDMEALWNTSWQFASETGTSVPFENAPFLKALHTGLPQTEVLVIRFRNGAQRWLHFTSQPLFEDNNLIPFAVLSSIVDVTEEKELSGKLEETNALLNVFMQKTPSLAWVIDEEDNLVFASQSFFRYFRLNEKESLNHPITDLLPGFVITALHEKHLQVLQSGVPTEFVEKVKWADGLNFVFHINIFPIEGVTGKKMIGGHAVNLADKYATEKKLREVNDRLLLLTRATSDAIWEWDMQSGTIFRNDVLMNMIGYHMDNPKGLSWWLRRIHPEDRNMVSDKVKESTDNGQQSWEGEYRFKCADGSYKQMRDKGYIVYENGLPVKMIGSLQDVSDLKELESQLMEEKLERQKEISETVIRAQEKERTAIGHELHDNVNQILSTVKLFVEMLTPVNREEREIKGKSIDYVMMAIDAIRKLSKELVTPQLIGKGLVDSIQTLVDDIHLSNTIKIRFTHDNENDLLSSGKKVTLFRIVQEQLKNILTHSRARQVDIFLYCKDKNSQLIIKDDGTGFDPTQTHRGIGLSNIYERARFYNGVADVQTAPGKGCSLVVSIPVF